MVAYNAIGAQSTGIVRKEINEEKKKEKLIMIGVFLLPMALTFQNLLLFPRWLSGTYP